MNGIRVFALSVSLLLVLAACSSPVSPPFSEPQTDSDRMPAYVQFSTNVDPSSVRYVGALHDLHYYLAQTDDPVQGVCLVIDNPEVSNAWATGCGGPSNIGVISAALGEARYASVGFSRETPSGWVRISDHVIALPPR